MSPTRLDQDGTTRSAPSGNFLARRRRDRRSRPRSTPRKGDSLGDSQRLQGCDRRAPRRPAGDLLHGPEDPARRDRARASSARPARQLLEKIAGDQLDQPVAGALTATAEQPRPRLHRRQQRRRHAGELAARRRPLRRPGSPSGIGNLGDVVKRTLDQLKDQIPNFDATVQQIQATTGILARPARRARSATPSSTSRARRSTAHRRAGRPDQEPDLTGRLLDAASRAWSQLGSRRASSRCSSAAAAPASRSTTRPSRRGRSRSRSRATRS